MCVKEIKLRKVNMRMKGYTPIVTLIALGRGGGRPCNADFSEKCPCLHTDLIKKNPFDTALVVRNTFQFKMLKNNFYY